MYTVHNAPHNVRRTSTITVYNVQCTLYSERLSCLRFKSDETLVYKYTIKLQYNAFLYYCIIRL